MAATTTTAPLFSMAGSIPAMAEAKELQSDGCVPRWKRIDEGDLLLHTCVYSKPDFLSILKFHDFVFFFSCGSSSGDSGIQTAGSNSNVASAASAGGNGRSSRQKKKHVIALAGEDGGGKRRSASKSGGGVNYSRSAAASASGKRPSSR